MLICSNRWPAGWCSSKTMSSRTITIVGSYSSSFYCLNGIYLMQIQNKSCGIFEVEVSAPAISKTLKVIWDAVDRIWSCDVHETECDRRNSLKKYGWTTTSWSPALVSWKKVFRNNSESGSPEDCLKYYKLSYNVSALQPSLGVVLSCQKKAVKLKCCVKAYYIL